MMSKVPTEKENCLGNILEKAKASCCFSLPFQSHIPSCRHLFGRNSSGAADEPPASRPFHHSGRVHSKSKDDLPHHTHTHRELRRERSGSCRRTTTTTSVDRLRIASREREQSLLQSLWLQQQQQQQDFTFPRKEDANFILDKISGKKYRRGKLLGKVSSWLTATFFSPCLINYLTCVCFRYVGVTVLSSVYIHIKMTLTSIRLNIC